MPDRVTPAGPRAEHDGHCDDREHGGSGRRHADREMGADRCGRAASGCERPASAMRPPGWFGGRGTEAGDRRPHTRGSRADRGCIGRRRRAGPWLRHLLPGRRWRVGAAARPGDQAAGTDGTRRDVRPRRVARPGDQATGSRPLGRLRVGLFALRHRPGGSGEAQRPVAGGRASRLSTRGRCGCRFLRTAPPTRIVGHVRTDRLLASAAGCLGHRLQRPRVGHGPVGGLPCAAARPFRRTALHRGSTLPITPPAETSGTSASSPPCKTGPGDPGGSSSFRRSPRRATVRS